MRGWLLLTLLMGTLSSVSVAHARDGSLDSVQEETTQIRREIDRMENLVDALPRMSARRQRAAMDQIVRYLDDVVSENNKRIEREVYTDVDRVTDAHRTRYTQPLREQNRILDRWIADLGAESRGRYPDTLGFMRRAHNIFGLLQAKYDVEERVILPIFERAPYDPDRDDRRDEPDHPRRPGVGAASPDDV